MSEAVFYTRLATQDLYPSAQELAARLKTPISYRDDAIDALENELRKTLCAAMCAVRVPILRNADESLDFPTFSTESEALKKAMEGCDEAFLLAVTLGMQTEQWLHRLSILSPAKHFTADALASAYAEAAADLATALLAKNTVLTHRFSPGYGDLPLSIQPQMLRATEANKFLHITLSDGLLMIPQKSITAVLDKGELRVPKVTGYTQSGMESSITEANELFQGGGDPSFSGENLAGASVKVIKDGSTLEIPSEHVTATDTQVTIAKSYLDDQDLFASTGYDAEFVFTTACGTAHFSCLISG